MEFTKENILGVFGDFRRGQLSFDNLEKEIMDLDDTPEKVIVPKFVAEWIELRDLRVEIQSVRERVDFQFDQLNAIVKSRSAKKGLEFLTEAGFDTSGLDLSVKHEVMTLEVDKDLLGLPEGDKK